MEKKVYFYIFFLLLVGYSWANPAEKQALVKRGENLPAVAKRCDTSVQHLIEHNNIKPPYKIYVGQPLKYWNIIKQDKFNLPASASIIEVPFTPLRKPQFPKDREKKKPILKTLKRTGDCFEWP